MIPPDAFVERTSAGLAAEIARLVSDGTLAPGERLPTVRDVAAALGVSTGTVASGWRAPPHAGGVV
jgi:DNA-binding transcriptional regulator YhcF (GntR family)